MPVPVLDPVPVLVPMACACACACARTRAYGLCLCLCLCLYLCLCLCPCLCPYPCLCPCLYLVHVPVPVPVPVPTTGTRTPAVDVGKLQKPCRMRTVPQHALRESTDCADTACRYFGHPCSCCRWYTSVIVLLDNSSNARMQTLVAGIEGKLEAAGVNLTVRRAQQQPFHSTLGASGMAPALCPHRLHAPHTYTRAPTRMWWRLAVCGWSADCGSVLAGGPSTSQFSNRDGHKEFRGRVRCVASSSNHLSHLSVFHWPCNGWVLVFCGLLFSL